MNPIRFLASSRRRSPIVCRRPGSKCLHIESLEQRRLLAIDTMAVGGASPWQNAAMPADVNADGRVSTQDAMMVINELNAHGPRSLSASIGRGAFFASTLRTAADTVDAGPMFLDTNGDGMLSPQDVLLIANQLNDTAESLVQIRLEITDTGGNPITQVNVGDTFQLRAFVLDLRTTGNTGVFSAFTDVTYSSALASAGSIVHSSDYSSFATGSAATPGLLDEVGGIAGSLTQLGPNERLLFTVPFTATAAGALSFTADPADLGASEVLLYDMNPVVLVSQVTYGADLLVVSPPEVSVGDVSLAEGSSGTTPFEFTVTLSHAYQGQVSVQYALQGNTATAGIDFLAASGTLTFDPGQTSKTFNVDVLGDTLNEANETFLVHLMNPSVGTLARGQATGTIVNDDTPVPTLSINTPAAQTENAGVTPIAFTVTLSAVSGQDVSVHFHTANGTATAGQDYVAQTGGTLTIPAGQLTGTINVSLLDDTLDEPDQTFTVTLSMPTNATIAVGQEAGTGTILDNDPQPSLSIAAASVNEGNSGTTALVFTVTLSAASEQAVNVSFHTVGVSATEGIDYDAATGTLTFAAGETTKTITVNVLGDTTVEPNETFQVLLSTPTNATIVNGGDTATGTIVNDDTPVPTLSINTPAAQTENAGVTPIAFTVTLSAISSQDVSVHFNTANGTATAGQDYAAQTGGTLAIPAGQLTGTINVSLLDDTLDEPDQTFTVTLSMPTNATIAAGQEAGTGTIVDNDPQPTLSIAAASVNEGNSGTTALVFTVTLSAASEQAVNVSFHTVGVSATEGIDYDAATGTLTFAAGETTKTITVNVLGDTTVEPNETFQVLLSTPTNATIVNGGDTATGTIVNDDTPVPTLSINTPAAQTENAGVTPIAFTVTLSAISSQDVSVHFNTANGTATAGQDYAAQTGGTLTIPAGQLTGTINVSLLDDTLDEPDQTFTVTLSMPTNATIAVGQEAGTGTILDNDPQPSLSIAAASVNEGNSGTTALVFTVTLSAASEQAVNVSFHTVGVSATEGIDYDAATGTLTFAAGETTKTITVNVLGDTTVEPNETFQVLLSTPTNATIVNGGDTATGTIVNDDTPVPTLSINTPAAQTENAGVTPIAFTVTLSAISSQDVSVHFNTANGTATAGQDYAAQTGGTLAIPAGQLTGTINVSLLDDTLDEPDQTFTVTLSMPTNATIAAGQEAGTGTIVDNDPQPTLSIAAASVNEGNSGTTALVFTVTLSAASEQAVNVSFHTVGVSATEGIDYDAATGTLTFAAGETTKTITVNVLGDTTVEPNETFQVLLSTPTNATIVNGGDTATGTIVNDDTPVPTLSINTPAAQTENAGVTPIAFTVTLSAISSQDVSVHFNTANGTATAGQDYAAQTGGTLAIPAGQLTGTINVSLLDDTLDEPDQTFTVTLSMSTNATIAAGQEAGTGTIVDNDPQPTLSIAAASVNEGNSGTTALVFTVTLSAASGQIVTAGFHTSDGTALAGSDYTAVLASAGTLTINPGATTGTIMIDVHGDRDMEPDETVQVTLTIPTGGNATLARATGVGTILDEDTPAFAGFVYNDLNHNGVKDPLETGIAGVLITLTGTDSMGHPVNLTRTTAADGFYRFSGLQPGDYMVDEIHPQDYMDGIETPGSAGITSSASDLFFASLAGGDQVTNNNFGEFGLKPQAINKALLFASMRG